MARRVFGIGLSGIILGLAGLALGKDYPTAPIPAPVLEKLVAQDAKFIRDRLAKPSLPEKFARKVKGGALLIAGYAQYNLASTPTLAGLRDDAVKLIQAVDAGKLAEAKKLAPALSLMAKANPGAKAVPVNLAKHLKLEFFMRIFATEKVGGFGLEKQLESLADTKGALPAPDQDKAVLLGYKIAVIARLAHGYAPTSDEGKKTKKSWDAFAAQMHKDALNLVDAAKANRNVSQAVDKLTITCTKCHDIFR